MVTYETAVWYNWVRAYAGTGDTWTTWNTVYDDCTTCSGTNGIWENWNGTANASTCTSTTYTTNADVWNQWVVVYHPAEQKRAGPVPPLAVAQLTPEELAKQAAEHQRFIDDFNRQTAERAAKEAEFRRLEKLSEDRAMALFKEFLNEQQRKELEAQKAITVLGSQGKVTYRITLGGRVYQLDDKTREVASFCIHSRDMCYPTGDEALAKLLLLTTDEERFLKIANKTVMQPVGAR